jgi:Transmembrane secretion effector
VSQRCRQAGQAAYALAPWRPAKQTMGEPPPTVAPAIAAAAPSAWSPFRHRLFGAMWGAQFVSNIGSWMQTVAA